jgi:carbon monoxide dehydrogenase subunit G
MRLENEIAIAAPADRVWALTLDIERWPDVTPTMTEITRLDDGPLAVGSQARVKQPAQRARVWTVTRLEPNHYEWDAKLGSIRMRGGHHITPTDTGCTNRLTLDIDGFGAGMFGLVAKRTLAKALDQENNGFKTAAEAVTG